MITKALPMFASWLVCWTGREVKQLQPLMTSGLCHVSLSGREMYKTCNLLDMLANFMPCQAWDSNSDPIEDLAKCCRGYGPCLT